MRVVSARSSNCTVNLRAALLEFIDEERSKADAKIKWPRLEAILSKIRAACDYLELKPNFCGLGLNLNKVLEPKTKTAEPRDQQPGSPPPDRHPTKRNPIRT